MHIFDYKAQRLKSSRFPQAGLDHPLLSLNEESLLERLSLIKRSFAKVLLLGNFSANFIAQLSERGVIHIEHFDPVQQFQDSEKMDFPWPSFNLIISNLHLHTANDVPGIMWQCRQLLYPDGLLLASLLGGESLIELREVLFNVEEKLRGGVSNRIHPMINFGEVSNLLMRAGFALPVADRDMIKFTYANMFDLVKDLRVLGQTNTLASREQNFAPRRLFALANTQYLNTFAENGKINATVELIYLTGWAPHVSQQKALAPGSAKILLRDILIESKK